MQGLSLNVLKRLEDTVTFKSRYIMKWNLKYVIFLFFIELFGIHSKIFVYSLLLNANNPRVSVAKSVRAPVYLARGSVI